MGETLKLLVAVFLKFFFLLAPFAVVTAFLSLTRSYSEHARRRTAIRTTVAIMIICLCLSLTGKYLFALFGITLDAFRIGAGALLFLSGLQMVMGSGKEERVEGPEQDVAVVPLAIPITVGPATTGALLIMGAEFDTMPARLTASAALFLAILVVGAVFYLGTRIEKLLGPRGIAILTKLTGLFLTSLAAQMIFTGIQNFLVVKPG